MGTRKLRLIVVITAVVAAMLLSQSPNFLEGTTQNTKPDATVTVHSGDNKIELMYKTGNNGIDTRTTDADGAVITKYGNLWETGDDAAKHVCTEPDGGQDGFEVIGFETVDECLDALSGLEKMHKHAVAATDVLLVGWLMALLSLYVHDGEGLWWQKALAAAPSVVIASGLIIMLDALGQDEFEVTGRAMLIAIVGLLATVGDCLAVFGIVPDALKDDGNTKYSSVVGI